MRNGHRAAALITLALGLFVARAFRWRVLKRQQVRVDAAGDGHFGTDRGDHVHMGLDLITTPGEPVFSPFSGVFVGSGYAYPNDPRFHALRFKSGARTLELLYVHPLLDLVPGMHVEPGQPVGVSQDISARYPGEGMLPHVHVEVMRPDGAFVNPARFLILDA